MKLTITDRDLLFKPLQTVSGIVERRHTLPILSNTLIEIRNGQLTLVTTDLEIEAEATSNIPELETRVPCRQPFLSENCRTYCAHCHRAQLSN